MKNSFTVLTEKDVRTLLAYAVEFDLHSINNTAKDGHTKREQYCATYNSASYKCIDWNHYVASGLGLYSYSYSDGKVYGCGF